MAGNYCPEFLGFLLLFCTSVRHSAVSSCTSPRILYLELELLECFMRFPAFRCWPAIGNQIVCFSFVCRGPLHLFGQRESEVIANALHFETVRFVSLLVRTSRAPFLASLGWINYSVSAPLGMTFKLNRFSASHRGGIGPPSLPLGLSKWRQQDRAQRWRLPA